MVPFGPSEAVPLPVNVAPPTVYENEKAPRIVMTPSTLMMELAPAMTDQLSPSAKSMVALVLTPARVTDPVALNVNEPSS